MSASGSVTERPYWYESNGGVFCQYCRAKMLREWAPGTVKNGQSLSPDEAVTRSDFTALGRTPWAGSPEGDRYMQCDACLEQWGPDA